MEIQDFRSDWGVLSYRLLLASLEDDVLAIAYEVSDLVCFAIVVNGVSVLELSFNEAEKDYC